MERLKRSLRTRSVAHNVTELNETPDSSSSRIVIAIMGVTGVGKSSFIEAVTGQRNIVGHSLESGTTDVKAYHFSHNSVRYVLVDTPGFDDHSMSNEEVTEKILLWLRSSYQEGTRLNGIIYIHSIAKPRMQGSAIKNMRVFRKLCGEQALGNVILATSFWDTVPQSVGEERESELRTSKDFWAGMIAKGSEMVRLNRGSRGACLQLMELIAAKNQVELAVQIDGTIELDPGPDEIQNVQQTHREEREELKRALSKKMEDGQRAYDKEMRAAKKTHEKALREEDQRQSRANKEYERNLKKDERKWRREREEGANPGIHEANKRRLILICLHAATFLWNTLITALLASVINDTPSGAPALINYSLFVVVVSWIVSIMGVCRLLTGHGFRCPPRSPLIPEYRPIPTFTVICILSDLGAIFFILVATIILSVNLADGCSKDDDRRSCQEVQACTAFFWLLLATSTAAAWIKIREYLKK